MITIRRSDERGHANHGWLDTHHTFSFAGYHDPRYMGFRTLRVINEDRVAPGAGFGTHPHRDMEIVSYVLSGGLEHRDSMGNATVLRPGDVQHMSAGTGIEHSEMNASREEPVHFLQIWIVPEARGLEPSHTEKRFPAAEKTNVLRPIVTRDGRDGALRLHQDVALYATILEPGQELTHTLDADRHAWVQVARGALTLNGQALRAGDGAAVSDERELMLAAAENGPGAAGAQPAEVLVFDLV